MHAKIFVSQSTIDAWVSSEKADLAGSALTLRGGGATLELDPASLFMSVSGGDDAKGLIGKVKSASALLAMGAEAYMTSVLLGETAYDVESGFLAVPLVPPPRPQDARALLASLQAASDAQDA